MPIYIDRNHTENYWKKKHSIQGIPWQQKGEENNETENKGCYKKQNLDRDGSKISKIVQSIQISPKTEWRLQAGGRHERSESIHETDLLQDGRNSNIRATYDEKQLRNFIRPEKNIQSCTGTSNDAGLIVQYQNRLYKYQGMLFDLNDTPKIFTQIMKKVVQAIKELWKIRCVIYLDDLLILHQNQNHLKRITPQITQFLQHLGWSVNLEKSNLIPSHQFKYLSWIWNSKKNAYQISF
jgi:hypothetical protein